MPGSGDTLRYSNAIANGNLPFTQSGSNQTWDFSNLTPTTQDIDAFRSSLTTPYAFFFLGLNKYGKKISDSLGVGVFQFTDIYNFYRKTASVFDVEGIGLRYQGIPLPAFYSDKDELYQFPLTYGRRDSSTFKFSISISTLIGYSQVGYRINEVEGWGSIITPFGTFNCLKVKSSIFSTDSLNISGIPIKFNQKRIEYKWLANGIKIPVMEISGNVLGSNFIPTTVKYRDIKRSNVLFQPPVAQFTASPTSTPVFSNVQFSNTSLGNFLQYKWTFDPTGPVNFENNTSDTSMNPVVTFSEPGLYSVKLRASNFLGQNEKTRPDYITVIDQTGVKETNSGFSTYSLNNQVFYGPDGLTKNNLCLVDVQGKQISINQIGARFYTTSQEELIPGVYLLRFENGKKSWNRRFIFSN